MSGLCLAPARSRAAAPARPPAAPGCRSAMWLQISCRRSRCAPPWTAVPPLEAQKDCCTQVQKPQAPAAAARGSPIRHSGCARIRSACPHRSLARAHAASARRTGCPANRVLRRKGKWGSGESRGRGVGDHGDHTPAAKSVPASLEILREFALVCPFAPAHGMAPYSACSLGHGMFLMPLTCSQHRTAGSARRMGSQRGLSSGISQQRLSEGAVAVPLREPPTGGTPTVASRCDTHPAQQS